MSYTDRQTLRPALRVLDPFLPLCCYRCLRPGLRCLAQHLRRWAGLPRALRVFDEVCAYRGRDGDPSVCLRFVRAEDWPHRCRVPRAQMAFRRRSERGVEISLYPPRFERVLHRIRTECRALRFLGCLLIDETQRTAPCALPLLFTLYRYRLCWPGSCCIVSRLRIRPGLARDAALRVLCAARAPAGAGIRPVLLSSASTQCCAGCPDGVRSHSDLKTVKTRSG